MVLYNFANITAANTTRELAIAVNDLTGGIFGILLLVSLVLIIMINLAFYNIKTQLSIASFFAVVISILAWISGLIPLFVVVVCIIFLIVSILITLMAGDQLG